LLDKNILKLVLANLLSNAIKYSPSDRGIISIIDFIVLCKSELLIFKITDRGIGIPVEEQSKIFEPFYRSENVGELPGRSQKNW
jgi:signal transduction histidine kinase